MQKLPKFAIKMTLGGNHVSAFFKPTGVANEVKVTLQLRGKSFLSYKTTLPKTEVLSWSNFVNSTLPKEYKNDELSPKVPLPGAIPLQKDGSKPGDNNSLLPGGPSRRNPSGVIFARDADPGELYQTAKSTDPKKIFICRFIQRAPKGKVILHVHFPAPLSEWKDVEVPETYLLRIHPNHLTKTNKEKEAMPKKETPQVTNAPTATSKEGLGVYEAWGKAFQAHGTKKNAPELIVAFMEKAFPGRKTKWAKWVNPVRARYNAGKLPGIRAPQEKIAVYSYDEKPSRKAERRKDERRTPPVKPIKPKEKKKAGSEPEPVA